MEREGKLWAKCATVGDSEGTSTHNIISKVPYLTEAHEAHAARQLRSRGS